jgi:hypothetical protein
MRVAAFHWIENRRTDLLYYIGSPLLGLLYLPLIFFGHRLLVGADGTPLYGVVVGGEAFPVTVAFVVMTSWALFIDGPHFWPTLVRTFLDPEEWKLRGPVLRRSLLLFLLGPAIIMLPVLLAAAVGVFGSSPPARLAALGAPAVLVVFLSWAYFHVVRQHWGFFRLYKRRADDFDPRYERLDTWFFHLAMFLPPLLFVTGPWYPTDSALYPNLGLQAPLFGEASVGSLLHPVLWAAYVGALLLYAGSLVVRLRAGELLNGCKLMFLAAIVPVHMVAFVHPALPLFSQALVGVGHALQYQRIVWRYGSGKYRGPEAGRHGLAARCFRNPWLYLLPGLAFTWLLLRGPWIEWLTQRVGGLLDSAFTGSSLPPTLGVSLLWGFFLGWLFQHYYLDARIWRLSRDQEVRRSLNV